MFNPYSVRPIGSQKFEEHLADEQTSWYYRTMMPEDGGDIGDSEMNNVHAPWFEDSTIIDPFLKPWVDLETAVLAMIIADYISEYRSGHTDTVNWMEKQYFEGNNGMSEILDILKKQVLRKGAREMDACRKRLLKLAFGGGCA